MVPANVAAIAIFSTCFFGPSCATSFPDNELLLLDKLVDAHPQITIRITSGHGDKVSTNWRKIDYILQRIGVVLSR